MLEEKITEMLDKLVQFGEKIGTPAFEAVVRGVQLEGQFAIILGFLTLGLFPIALGFFTLGLIKVDGTVGNEESRWVALIFGSALVTVFSFIAACILLFNASTWIAMLDPVAEIARRLVMGG